MRQKGQEIEFKNTSLIEISKRSRKRSLPNRPPGNKNKSDVAERLPE
jgi:hypothetical protein